MVMTRLETIHQAFRNYRTLITTAILSLLILSCSNNKSADTQSNLENRTLDSLISEGLQCVEADSLNDRAIALFTIVAKKYYEDQTDTVARRAASEALYHLGNLYLTHNIDYRLAYKSLMTSRRIAEEDSDIYRLAGVYNSLAHLYHYNANGKADINNAAVEFLKKAAATSVRSGNEDVLPSVIINIALLTIEDGKWGTFSEAIHQIKDYGKRMPPPHDNIYEWVKLVTDGVDQFYAGNQEIAEQKLLAANRIPDNGRYSERSIYSVNLMLIQMYRASGQTDKAIDLIHQTLAKARSEGHTDYELSMYAKLTNIYEVMGQPDSADLYYTEYLKLKALFEADNGFDNIQTLDFKSEIDKINNDLWELSLARQREKQQRMIMLCALSIITIICLAIIWGYINLKRNHKNLFKRNEEMTRRETQYRLMREQWEAEKKQLMANIPSDAAPTTESETPPPSDDEKTDPADNEEEWLDLFKRILNVMESSRDIYKTGYTISDLADSLGITTRTASRAINICYHSNFNTLLNDYRIREVSRLMHAPGAENLTIESLAESAGYSSRTYFSTIFKKSTGLTPSEYLRIAKKR